MLFAAGILQLTGWTPVNAVVTLFIAALMLWGGSGVVRDTVRVLLEGAPAAIRPEDLTRTMEAVGGVDEVYDLHERGGPCRAALVTHREGNGDAWALTALQGIVRELVL